MEHSIAPLPALLGAIQSEKWSIRGALSELIDNSFGGGRGDADDVWIYYDRGKRTLKVIDNGRGMEQVYLLFRAGAGTGRVHGDIGHYGAGGTKAIIWIPHTVTVFTMRNGKVSWQKVNWPQQFAAEDYVRVPDKWYDATPKNTPAELLSLGRGTYIEMRMLQGRNFQTPSLISEIAETYGPGLRSGKRILWVMHKGGNVEKQIDVKPSLADIFTVRERISFDETVDVLGTKLPLRGEITLSDAPYAKSEVAIGFGYRVILKTRDCFTSPETKRSHFGSGVSGWIDLGEGWQAHLTLTKDEFKDDDVRDALYAFIFEKAKPFLERVEESENQIVLENLAIGLRDAFAITRDLVIDQPGPEPEPQPEPGPDLEPRPEPDLEPEPQPEPPEDDEEPEPPEPENGPDEPLPAMATIEIRQVPDKDIEGRICDVYMQTDGSILALVNEDHFFVQVAMSRPKNKAALVALITRELSGLIASDDDILDRAFQKRKTRELIRRYEGLLRQRYVMRLLMDFQKPSIFGS